MKSIFQVVILVLGLQHYMVDATWWPSWNGQQDTNGYWGSYWPYWYDQTNYNTYQSFPSYQWPSGAYDPNNYFLNFPYTYPPYDSALASTENPSDDHFEYSTTVTESESTTSVAPIVTDTPTVQTTKGVDKTTTPAHLNPTVCTNNVVETIISSDDLSCPNFQPCLGWVQYCRSVAKCVGKDRWCSGNKYNQMGFSFMFSFISNREDNLEPSIIVTSGEETDVSAWLSIPALDIHNEEYVFKKYLEIKLPIKYLETLGDIDRRVSNLGIEIVSYKEVAVSIMSGYIRSYASSLVLPKGVLGREYIIDAHDSNRSGLGEVAVTAVSDNTEVVLQFPSGETDTAVLNKLDDLTRRLSYLSGTIITSSNPVSVQVGHDCVNTPNDDFRTCDIIATEVLPSKFLESSYILPQMYPRKYFSVGYVAPYDETFVFVFDIAGKEVDSFRMSRQESIFRIYNDTLGLSVISTNPILVTQYGHSSNMSMGDPSVITVPSPNQYSQFYDFVVPEQYFNESIMCIIMYELYDVQGLRLDGEQIIPDQTVHLQLPCAGQFKIMYMDIGSGFHSLRHDGDHAKFAALLFSRGIRVEIAANLGFEVVRESNVGP